MKNHELLDMIGEVNEEHVLAADEKVIRPKFRWKTLAVCAACAALVAGSAAIWAAGRPGGQAASTAEGPAANEEMAPDCAPEEAPVSDPEAYLDPGGELVQRPGLHSYFLVEGTAELTAGKEPPQFSVPSAPAPDPAPFSALMLPPENGDALDAGGAESGGFAPAGGAEERKGDVPVEEDTADQYDALLRGMGVQGQSEPTYPDWYGGAWIDHSGGPEDPAWLRVAIVYGYRTPELEEQIRDWCGGTQEVQFTGAIYSQNHLDGLMKEMDRVFEELDCRVFLSYGVYPSDNCIHLDFFDIPDDGVLAALAELDPDGGAIYIQVFTDRRNVLTDGSGQEFSCDPGDASPQPTPAEASQGDVPAAISTAPGGAEAEELPQAG